MKEVSSGIHTTYRIKFYHIVIVLVIGGLFLCLPPHNPYAIRAYSEIFADKESLIAPSPAPYPIKISQAIAPQLTSEGVYIVDVTSGVVVYEKNPDQKLFPASTTKIMTALVALEEYKLDDVVNIQNPHIEGQVMGLTQGETITIENLLYGILVHSANDAAYALAQFHPGGVEQFVEKMNTKATALHLTNTHFKNPAGFDDPEQFTTARDLARLSLATLENPTLSKIVGIPQITVSDTTFVHFHPLKNINELLGKVPGVSGFKTGFTQAAGQSLVTTVQRNNHKVLIVVLKSQDRFGETEQLVNWIFTNYAWKEFGV